MEERKASPDEILEAISTEERNSHRGKLKIFFGYAAGVGKTYAMLKAAHAAKNSGYDVVAGYIEPHPRPQTAALLNGLEVIPYKKVEYNGITLNEFDLDTAIKRNPELILVDELAHTNAQVCRHTKRYQDIEELLNAGIDVYTTVNVQHIESLNDMVASITGIIVRERIPDKIFDSADQVEIVDIEPQELINRFSEGKIYRPGQVKSALGHFFTVENLTALREIALRRCADRANKFTENARIKNNTDYFTDEHILVCLSSSPSNPKIIRTAARMTKAFHGNFTALFVETPDFAEMGEENRKRLRENMHLAEQLGATIETTYGDDIAFQISEFARLSGVSKIVLGRSSAKKKFSFGKSSLTEKITSYSPNLDIYIIPDNRQESYHEKKRKKSKEKFSVLNLLKTVGIMSGATVLGFIFEQLGVNEANIITLYILAVLVISIVTTNRWYSFVSSAVSVLIFNFFFTVPKFTLCAYDPDYPATFLVMFLSAFLTSNLALKIKKNAKQSALTAYRTKILFDTNKLLQQADDEKSVAEITSNQLVKLLNRDIVFYSQKNGNLSEPQVFTVNSDSLSEDYISVHEQATAEWTLKNNKRSGATTNTLSSAKCLYMAVRVNSNVYGVVGIVINNDSLDSFENSIVLSILGECALAMENLRNIQEKEDAAVLARNEQLRANLLRSISHDLRTPLTSISGNAGILISNSNDISEEKRMNLYKNIYDDSMWLINLVENLLSVTRIEDGSMKLHLSTELMDDVIHEALSHLGIRAEKHKITVHQQDEFLMAKMDARLIVQVIINIIDNAFKYTQEDSEIDITVSKNKQWVAVEIADNGPGIAEESKKKIFDMFYTAETKIADSRRSMGLGLALCKSIITAHGGEITVHDNSPKGTVFSFTLPAEEVNIHE